MGFFQTQSITEKYENAIDRIITHDNFNRTRKFAIFLFLVNFILLFIDYNNNIKGLWITNDGYKYSFFFHAVLGLGTLLFIFSSNRIIAYSTNEITLAHNVYGNPICPFFA